MPGAEGQSGTVVSLAPAPHLLFPRLKAFVPQARRVIVVHNPRQNDWLIRLAREAARQNGLELLAFESEDLKGSLKRYQELIGQLNVRRDALWLPQDTSAVDDSVVLPWLLRTAWDEGLPVFSSNVAHVRRGALFALYPDNLELGRHLGSTAMAALSGGSLPPRGMQALRQGDRVERDDDEAAAEHADDGAEHRFQHELRQHVAGRARADRDVFHQHEREEDREGIVGAGFGLQRRADARAQAQALGVHQQVHGGRVGRSHHGADQQRLHPVEIEREFGERRRDQRCQQHADGREQNGRRQHGADAGKARPQTAVEQDQGERDGADQIGGADVVELNLAGTGIAGEHADGKEHQ